MRSVAPLPRLRISKPRNAPRTCRVRSSRHERIAIVNAAAPSSRAPLPEYTRLPDRHRELFAAWPSRVAVSVESLSILSCRSLISRQRADLQADAVLLVAVRRAQLVELADSVSVLTFSITAGCRSLIPSWRSRWQRIKTVWAETRDARSTQLVFCDLSTPNAASFNVYDEVRTKLLESGVPKAGDRVHPRRRQRCRQENTVRRCERRRYAS